MGGEDRAKNARSRTVVCDERYRVGYEAICNPLFSTGQHDQIWSNPRRMAMVTACVRSLARSLDTRFLIWKLTVVSAMVN
jgi:hypothetical protein